LSTSSAPTGQAPARRLRRAFLDGLAFVEVIAPSLGRVNVGLGEVEFVGELFGGRVLIGAARASFNTSSRSALPCENRLVLQAKARQLDRDV